MKRNIDDLLGPSNIEDEGQEDSKSKWWMAATNGGKYAIGQGDEEIVICKNREIALETIAALRSQEAKQRSLEE